MTLPFAMTRSSNRRDCMARSAASNTMALGVFEAAVHNPGVASSIVVGLNAVIVAVTDDEPRLLTVERSGHAGPGAHEPALPFGPLDPAGHRTLELGLRGWVREQTGIDLGYVEQLYTFADRNRDPRERAGGPRVVSIAYLALVREGRVAGAGRARWRDFYEFLPWEDARRGGRPSSRGDRARAGALGARGADRRGARARRERADIIFGLRGAPSTPCSVLERYELLYEAGLVEESWRDRRADPRAAAPIPRRADDPRPSPHSRDGPRAPARQAASTGRSCSSCCRRPSRCSTAADRRSALRGAPAQAELPPPGGDRGTRRAHGAIRTQAPAAGRPSSSASVAKCCANARRRACGSGSRQDD